MKTIENSEIKKITGRNVRADAPKISIITPAYKIAGYIAETLDSVLAQTFKDYEIIVINDGSPDTEEFEKALRTFADEMIYLKQENKGAGAARNAGIEAARGELIAFLDGDDIWKPDFLASQIEFLEKNKYDLVYSDALLFGGSPLAGRTFMQNAPSDGEANFDNLLDLRCNVITSGVVARRQAILDVGMFEWEKVHSEDFLLWLKMAQNGSRFGYQKKVLLKYRIRIDGLSGDSIQRIERGIKVFERVAENLKLNDAQNKIIERQIARLEVEKIIERGKSLLLQKDFVAARDAFKEADKYRNSSKLKLIIHLLKFAPQLVLKTYKAQRTEEITFIPHKNSTDALVPKNPPTSENEL